MFDVPLDGWYAYLGTAVVATVLLGTALGFPTAPPPDAAAVANAVDAVAARDPPAATRYRLAADAVAIDPGGVTLRSDAGVAHARFAFGPVVPVTPGTQLAAVAGGTEPSDAFPDGTAFRRALDRAMEGERSWRRADVLVVRRVAWGGEDATLVLTR